MNKPIFNSIFQNYNEAFSSIIQNYYEAFVPSTKVQKGTKGTFRKIKLSSEISI